MNCGPSTNASRKRFSGQSRWPGKPTLASEISRIRNAFSHYFNRTEHEPLLTAAMRLAGDIDGNLAYVIRERTMRAEYADEVANKIVYPWTGLSNEDWLAAARALQERIVALIDPLTSFLHHAEAAFLASRPPGVVERIDLP